MSAPNCCHCGQELCPDWSYLSMAGQDWTRWVHWNRTYVCFPQQPGSPRAEPADWGMARDEWIGDE